MLRSWLRWLFGWMPHPWRQEVLVELGHGLESGRLENVLRRLVLAGTDSLSAEEALRFLLRLDGTLYALQGRNAVRYGGGVHVKHRLMGYHDFFVARIRAGERVLDVGCGQGALTRAMAVRCGARVVGIDIQAENIAKAGEQPHPLVEYRLGDATAMNELEPYDVVVLSNVLEHLTGRPTFLRRLMQRTTPSRVLIRVPLFEREWRVPLKRELGVEWRLDNTHETEYTLESFAQEMAEAGLRVRHQEVRWGEIWAELAPVEMGPVAGL